MQFSNVQDARKQGISAVFQELSLIPNLTVAQNLCLGEEPLRYGLLDTAALFQLAQRSLDELGFSVDPSALVATLSRAQQQMVEIAKGLRGQVSVLILDEPTASLTALETSTLFALIGRLKEQGVGIVYISHRIQEFNQIADRATVLRDGKKICTVKIADTSHDQLISLMSGRTIEKIYPDIKFRPGQLVLDMQHVSTTSGVQNASIKVRRGEVVGLAGLVGCGKSELLRAAYGLGVVSNGKVFLKGMDHTRTNPSKSLNAGYFYLPPDRKSEGLLLSFTSATNITLPALSGPLRGLGGWLRKKATKRMASNTGHRVELSAHNLEKVVGLLSGGNQQKVLFAKGLTRDMDLYVFDEPTVGVDIPTRSVLYKVIKQLCENGAAVVLVSSDLPEVLYLAHRAYVMCRGEVVGELKGTEITENNLLSIFFGAKENLA